MINRMDAAQPATEERKGEEEELTEEQQQAKQAKLERWRHLAKKRTEILEQCLDKLTNDPKIKETMMRPVVNTRDRKVMAASESFFHFIVDEMPRDLTRRLIEKSTRRKNAHKNIAEFLETASNAERIYSEMLEAQERSKYATTYKMKQDGLKNVERDQAAN